MITNNTKQSGFSAVIGIVAVVVVIGVLGFIGWRLYGQPSAKTNASKTTVSSTTPTTPPATPQPTYLDIKEFGVKLTLNNSINDAVYAPYTPQPTDGSQAMGISAQSLVNAAGTSTTWCAASHGPLGIIVKTTTAPTYVGSQKPLPVDNKSLFKFGNTYYWYKQPQNIDCTSSQITNSMVGDKVNAFTQAFTTLQSDQ